MELENALLNKCIQFFDELIITHENDEFYGDLPGYIIIDCSAARRMTEHFYKRTLKKRWKYIAGEITEENLDKELSENLKSGMYYTYAHASFYWDIERKKAFIGIVFGPRYGRGYSYDIVEGENGFELDNEDIDWVS